MKACFFTTSDYAQVLREQYTYADMRILKELGFEVIFSNRLLDIPLDCDIYYSWWASGSIYPLIVAKMVRKPNIVVAGGNEAQLYRDSQTNQAQGYLAGSFLKKIATRLTIKFSTRTIAVSSFMTNDLIKLGCVSPLVVHNCVDTNKFIPNKEAAKEFVTTSFRLDKEPTLVKRGENFILAAALVSQSWPSARFLVIGHKGSSYECLFRLVCRLGLEANFHFTGGLDNHSVVEYLQRSICFVQPSDTETFGVAVAEAMSVGCPVVLSSRGALPELADNIAIYVDHNSPESIANGIMKLLKLNSTELINIGLDSRARIIGNFSYAKRKDAISRLIFEDVLKES